MSARAAAAVAALLAGCEIGMHIEKHPLDVEDPTIDPLSTGACGAMPVTSVDALLGDGRPPDGTVVAVEGTPVSQMLCTEVGCASECCENACGNWEGCAFMLPGTVPVGAGAVCLSHADFVCGGTDCSPYCAPFSLAPALRYRFVGTVATLPGSGDPFLDVTAYCWDNVP